MRFIAVRIASLGAALAVTAVSACVPVERGTVEVARVKLDSVGIEPVAIPEFVRAAPEEVAERAFVGGALGAMLGAGLGAITTANPAFGALLGGSTGAAIGTVIGIATTPPLPGYTPIAVPARPVIPGFYDAWPPGYSSPPNGVQAPPPLADWSPVLGAKIVSGEDLPPAEGLAPIVGAPPAPL
jgi:hypothetical protein